MRTVAGRLDGHDGVSRVRVVEATRAGHSVVLAAVRPRAVDLLVESLHELGIPDDDITLMHVEVVGRAATGRPRPASYGRRCWARRGSTRDRLRATSRSCSRRA